VPERSAFIFCELEDFYTILNLRQVHGEYQEKWTHVATSEDKAWLLTSDATATVNAVSTLILPAFKSYWDRKTRHPNEGMTCLFLFVSLFAFSLSSYCSVIFYFLLDCIHWLIV
jgi:hypothetical protein